MREFQAIESIVRSLRDPDGGCPWDLEQTHKSLCKHAIEETYELVDAIELNNKAHIKEELGDVLLQVMIHSEIARQEGSFDIFDVIESISSKMVRRHPHVFSDLKTSGAEEVLKNWEKIKKQENANKNFFDMPKHFPALSAANKIGSKSKKVDFDWNTVDEVWNKVDEEQKELKQAIENNDKKNIEEEIGDLLFAVSQLSRHLNIDPELALRRSNQKFIERFDKMQTLAEVEKKDFSKMNLNEKEELWQKAKIALRPST